MIIVAAPPHWRRWLGPAHRCVAPFTAFAEPGPDKQPVWFAPAEDQPVAFFARNWTRWTSVRKVKDGETTNNLFGFLTCAPNALVGAVHPSAMPVILTRMSDVDVGFGKAASRIIVLDDFPDALL